MKYQTLETSSGNVLIKDAEDSELNELIGVYKSVFKLHNIFQKTDEDILEYLKEAHKKNLKEGGGFIVAKLKEKTIGGILVRKKGCDLEGKHSLWIYNHLGLLKDCFKMGIGSALMRAADKKIKNLIKEGIIKTAKIEIGVSEEEHKDLSFFKKNGFEVEGESKSHYRLNEMVYIMGKEIG